MNQIRQQLVELRLHGFTAVLDEMGTVPSMAQLSVSELLAVMVERELCLRQNNRVSRLQKAAKLRYPQVYPEDIDFHKPRQFNQPLLRELMQGHWLARQQNIILNGPTGVGKSFIACALGQLACRSYQSVRYYRVPRLIEQLAIAHVDGSYNKLLEQLAKVKLLILDDWGLDQLERQGRKDLLEVIEDRSSRHSTILTTQLPIEQWHQFIGDPTIADAICDRLLHQAHILKIDGKSGRELAQLKEANLTDVDH